MRRLPIIVGALATVTALTLSGAAGANPLYSQSEPMPFGSQPVEASQTAPWHYVWQYHYARHGEWVPGWVAVLNGIR